MNNQMLRSWKIKRRWIEIDAGEQKESTVPFHSLPRLGVNLDTEGLTGW